MRSFMALSHFQISILSALIGLFIVTTINIFTHIKKVNRFYNNLTYLAETYCTNNPNININYFSEIICDPIEMYMKFWVSNFDEFIIENDKVDILLNQKIEPVYKCPWCDTSEFVTLVFDSTDFVTVQCKECGATTPMSKNEEDCMKMLEIK